MAASGGTVSERSVTPVKEHVQYMDETTDKAGTLAVTEMETAVVQERGHESSQAGKAPGSDTGEPQTACDSAGSETPVQPDGGLWAWIVCLTAMLNYGTVSGLVNSLSLVYVIMLKEFSHGDVSLAFKISWVSTLVLLTSSAPSVLAGILSDRFGIRQVAFIGGFLAFVGTLSSAFIKEVLLLYLTFGVLVGVGFCFTISPSFVVLGHYFNKRLGVANGIMTCGGGMLSIGYVWILPLIYDQLGLRNALLCASGLSFLQMGYALTWIPIIHRERQPGPQQEMTTQCGENEQEDSGVAGSCTEDHGELRREPSCQSANRKGRTAGQQEVTARKGAHARVDGGRWCCCKTGNDGLLNVRIWKNRRYVLWVVSSVIACFGYFVLPFHNVKFSQDNFPDSDSEILPICSAAGAVASRLLLITIADRERVRNYHVQIHQAVFFALGAITMSLPLATDFVWLIVGVTFQGMCDGAYFCLIGPIAIKTVGVLDSSQAVGFYIGLCGLSMTVGSSMAGLLNDYLGSYTLAFPVLGAPLLVGGALLFLLPCVAPAESVSPSDDDGTQSKVG